MHRFAHVVGAGRRLAMLLLCACLLACVHAPAVRAEGLGTMSAVEQERLSELTEWAYRNGATVSAPECGGVCNDLWLAEHEPASNPAVADELWGELNALEEAGTTEEGIALMPDLGEFAFTISPYSGAIALGVGAFALGWHIGGKIDKWLGISVPAKPAEVEGVSLQWFEAGDTWPFPTFHDVMAMPFSGFAVMSSTLAGIVGQQSSGLPGGCERPGPQTFPAGFVVLRWWWNLCFNGYGLPESPVNAIGLVAEPETLVPSPVQDYDGQSSDATTEGLADPGAEVVERRLEDALESGRYPLLNQWLDHRLGGSSDDPLCTPVPGARTIRVPPIVPGQTAADYEDCLDALGLTEHVRVTVPVEQAVLAQPARGAVGVEPDEGEAIRPETQVTVRANPDPLPDPSALGEPESECEPSSGSYPVAAPPNDPTPERFSEITDPSLVERADFLSTRGNTVLRWGELTVEEAMRGWGYKHIKGKHGWSRVDEVATRDALITIGFEDDEDPDSYSYFGPQYELNGHVCTREVIVNYGVQGEDPGAKGIVTSYGRPVSGLPAVMRPTS